MDALCVSVIPNYWTLPFKASLRCISHFCLSDWWRAGSDWGHCVLNTASVVIHYLLQIQHAAAVAAAAAASFSAPLFHCNFLDLYSFSCSVIECIVSMCSVMVRCKEKWDYISCFFLKEVFKATKIHRGERSLQGGGCTLIPSGARIQYLRLAAPRKCIHFKAYRNCSHKFENFIFF